MSAINAMMFAGGNRYGYDAGVTAARQAGARRPAPVLQAERAHATDATPRSGVFDGH